MGLATLAYPGFQDCKHGFGDLFRRVRGVPLQQRALHLLTHGRFLNQVRKQLHQQFRCGGLLLQQPGGTTSFESARIVKLMIVAGCGIRNEHGRHAHGRELSER